ncbi:hypothetical protein C1646_781536, partial [Rhizophagus diaphanus]
DTSIIIKTLISAGELYLQELIKYLQSFLIKNKSEWMEQNFDIVYNASFENDSFLDLQNYCTDLISKQPDKIFNSLNFSLIPEKLLISVIQNNDLQTTEIQVWDHVLKWGLSQHPDFPSDPINYSKDDFITLKNTLKQCIPFIRFHNLTSKEFLDKVFPYRKILPKELYIDLLKEFLGNDNKKSGKSKPRMNKEISLITIDSKIISFQQAELILKWVDRSKIKLTSPCEFKLLFRGSRDGLTREKFHQYCDDHSRTVTIVKVKDNNEILGGYNPVEWRSYGGDTTILARDREVVAVNLRVLSDGCEVSIAKNRFWLDKDREYVEKIKETLTNVSKDAPMKFKQACGREDMRDLILTILEYCSEKFRYYKIVKEDFEIPEKFLSHTRKHIYIPDT